MFNFFRNKQKFNYGDNPIEINFVEDFLNMSDLIKNSKVKLNFKLNRDLDFKDEMSYKNTSIKYNIYPVGCLEKVYFNACFDGNNHTISNVEIFNDMMYYHSDFAECGLFGYLKNAEIKNLNLKNIFVIGEHNTGILAGSTEKSIIKNCIIENSQIEVISNNTKSNGLSLVLGKSYGFNEIDNIKYNVGIYLNKMDSYNELIQISETDKITNCVNTKFLDDKKILKKKL